MATSALLKLEGQQQGWIKGGVISKGREGLIEITSWSWGAERNFQGTTPTGSPTVSEFHITKKRDQATPKLLNAFANNEQFGEWRFDLWDPSPQGVETNTMRIELQNARIASDRYGGVETGASNPPDAEEVTFVFEKITVTWLNGGIVGTLEQ
jgi:type VI secretion system Hcp family effector